VRRAGVPRRGGRGKSLNRRRSTRIPRKREIQNRSKPKTKKGERVFLSKTNPAQKEKGSREAASGENEDKMEQDVEIHLLNKEGISILRQTSAKGQAWGVKYRQQQAGRGETVTDW